jgi:integrase
VARPYSAKELATLIAQCRAKDDDVRWLLGMVADTGARLAEITGLTLNDIDLDAETPHIVIKRHPWRALKNAGSARSVPLVGQALWAAKRVKKAAVEGQRFAFPRYTTAKVTKANGASAALNKWIKEAAKLDHTVHELRHTMADRLREVQCPADVRLAIGGWAREGEGEGYGDGYTLRVMAQWLAKVA